MNVGPMNTILWSVLNSMIRMFVMSQIHDYNFLLFRGDVQNYHAGMKP